MLQNMQELQVECSDINYIAILSNLSGTLRSVWEIWMNLTQGDLINGNIFVQNKMVAKLKYLICCVKEEK